MPPPPPPPPAAPPPEDIPVDLTTEDAGSVAAAADVPATGTKPSVGYHEPGAIQIKEKRDKAQAELMKTMEERIRDTDPTCRSD